MDNFFDASTLLIAIWLVVALLHVTYLKSKGLCKKIENELSQHFSYRLVQVLYMGSFILIMAWATLLAGSLLSESWESGFWVFVIGYLASYVVLNLFREALLYLFLQKPFSWAWLLSLLNFIFFGKLKSRA